MTAIVTGSCGLVGSAVTRLVIEQGMEVVGVDNDTRGKLFGAVASIHPTKVELMQLRGYEHYKADISSQAAMTRLWKRHGNTLDLVVHTAGQPSHDWSANHVRQDFTLNASAALNLLELTRQYSPNAVFVFLSTNKVYGDVVNHLMDIRRIGMRYDWDPEARPLPWVSHNGVNEHAPIDQTMHSPFGVSKAAADLMVQEYGRYFNLQTVCFRCGCITGAAHKGVKLHGFLAYLAKCVRFHLPYTIFGYQGLQVRDNIHAEDLAAAIWSFYQRPGIARVYNMGGGRENSCSIREAIAEMTDITGEEFEYVTSAEHRKGDHKWWITDTEEFEYHYPGWKRTWDLHSIYESLLGV